MLTNETLDLVVHCARQVDFILCNILAAAHGVHVVSGKPMATRYNDGLRNGLGVR